MKLCKTYHSPLSKLALAAVAASSVALAIPTQSQAATLLDIDFEGANDFGFSFGFSDGNQVVISNDQNSANGNGSEGSEITIVSTSGTPAFAGGGWGVIDLANDPGVVAGSITAAQLDSVNIMFDMEVVGTGISGLRFEASLPAGDFNNRVDGPTPTGGWTTYDFSFSSLDATQRSNMLASLNANNETELNMAFSFNQTAGMFTPGDSVRLDNLTATTVPEPGSVALLGLALAGVAMRRRR